jgi:hypothetical protein
MAQDRALRLTRAAAAQDITPKQAGRTMAST